MLFFSFLYYLSTRVHSPPQQRGMDRSSPTGRPMAARQRDVSPLLAPSVIDPRVIDQLF